MSIKVNDLEKAIMKELSKYQQEVTDALKEEVRQVAEECVQEIKQRSPRRKGKGGGKYKRSWKAEVAYEGYDDIRIIVCSKKHYRLTHLLEHGHAGPGGTAKGSAAPISHIGIAERHAAGKLLEKVKVVVKG